MRIVSICSSHSVCSRTEFIKLNLLNCLSFAKDMFSPIERKSTKPCPFLSSVAKAIPAFMASPGERISVFLPSIIISPLLFAWCKPKRHSKSSVRPEPSKPAKPKISPSCSVKSIFERLRLCPPCLCENRRLRFETSRIFFPIAALFCG